MVAHVEQVSSVSMLLIPKEREKEGVVQLSDTNERVGKRLSGFFVTAIQTVHVYIDMVITVEMLESAIKTIMAESEVCSKIKISVGISFQFLLRKDVSSKMAYFLKLMKFTHPFFGFQMKIIQFSRVILKFFMILQIFSKFFKTKQ